jgi:radical SAM-linked protein
LSIRWAVVFAIEGDVRFLSHHDMMRLMERATARAKLPVKYTQGFNPHPRLSLALPKPVGVSSQCEALVLELTEPPAAGAEEELARQLPPGMRVLRSVLLEGKGFQIESVQYELALEESEVEPVQQRLARLQEMDTWNIVRLSGEDSPQGPTKRDIDLKPKIAGLGLRNGRVQFMLLGGQESARPAEVLQLLGFVPDERAVESLASCMQAMARLHRVSMQCADLKNDKDLE